MDPETTNTSTTEVPVPEPEKKEVWAIGGGKGGVGKSLITANLAIALSRQGHRVLLVDLDLGGANLHTCLGVSMPFGTLSDFIDGGIGEIKDVIAETGIPNLHLINGARDSVTIANIRHTQKLRLLNRLRKLDYDYVLFDLGAGTSFNMLDFFLEADKGLIVLIPEPTSVENIYRFVKSAYYRQLNALATHLGLRNEIASLIKNEGQVKIESPAVLIEKLKGINFEKGEKIEAELKKFCPKLIMNMVRSHSDMEVGYAVRSVFRKYFGIGLDYVGYLDYDNAVWQSIRKKRPFLLEFPNSKLVRSFERISKTLSLEEEFESLDVAKEGVGS
ncbi:P-loop NTPase [Bdellovibrionota bacterium]